MHYIVFPCFRDREVQTFSQFSTQFDGAVRNMAKMASDQTTKCQNHYKREFSNIGKCFTGLGQAMEQDGGGYNQGLDRAVLATGECYEEIGRLYEEQPRLDWEIIQDMMHDYRGLLSGWPQVLQIHSVCVRNIRNLVRIRTPGYMTCIFHYFAFLRAHSHSLSGR